MEHLRNILDDSQINRLNFLLSENKTFLDRLQEQGLYSENQKRPVNIDYRDGKINFKEPNAPYVYFKNVPFELKYLKPEFYDSSIYDGIKELCDYSFKKARSIYKERGIIKKGKVKANNYPLLWQEVRRVSITNLIKVGEQNRHFWNRKASIKEMQEILDDIIGKHNDAEFWKNEVVFHDKYKNWSYKM